MALYFYQALSRDGKKVSGALDATSEKQVKEQLSRGGLYVISVVPMAEQQAKFSFASLFERTVSVKDKLMFTQQFAVLLKAGVPLVDALNLLIDQMGGSFKKVIVTLRDGVREGKSLAEMMAQYPKVFEPIYVQLIRAGEASGRLEFVLDRLTEYLERREELNRRVSGALVYPIVQMVMILGIGLFLMVVIAPQILAAVAQLAEGVKGFQVPLVTRIVQGLSNFLVHYYLWLAIGILLVVVAFLYWRATVSGRRTLDAIKLKTPKINYFVRMNATVRFSRTLGLLLESGVSLSEALDIVCAIVDNKILEDTLRQAREQIIKQGKIAEYLKKTDLFPPMAIYLINTGEQSGALDTMLATVANRYEADLIQTTDSLVSLLNPITMVFMGVMVVTIIAALMLPMFNLVQMIQSQA